MSALGGDEHAAALREFGRQQRPKAIAIVSAHWQTPAPVRVTSWESAPLVYDFGGFPPELYRLTWPAPGDPPLAARVSHRLPGSTLEPRRGLDHGAWVPLRLAWPEADIPVVQLSLPTAPPRDIFALGQALRPLREDGILIAASGGIVHNLRRVHFLDKKAPVDDWASEFDRWVQDRLDAGDLDALFAYAGQAPQASLAVPTTEHFDPLFAALGAAGSSRSRIIYEGFQYGSLSMRSLAWD